MIEHHIKAMSCRVSCGNNSGTGWLIVKDIIITARHCVLDALTDGKPVELFFPEKFDSAVAGKIVAESEQWDACLVSFEGLSGQHEPLPLGKDLPREGGTWETFGYPMGKLILGHRLVGTVEQVLDAPKLKIDLDLSIDSDKQLSDYRGLSGAVVICEGLAVGMIRLKVDGTLAALSLNQLESFLADNEVLVNRDSPIQVTPLLAERGVFAQDFAEAILKQSGSYLFLEGAHGYGKTTFCSTFQPENEKFINLGVYLLSDPESVMGAEYKAQPQVFLEWLTTKISALITGKPPRKEEISYFEQIQKSAHYLNEFSNYCERSSRQGVLFIDGLNEVAGDALLQQLTGLLPNKLPANITIVLTAPNFANTSGALAGKVKTKDVFELPPLPSSESYRYCLSALKTERRSSELADRLCKKANGHPLYLRYLIEYANSQALDDELNDFPTLTGSIEEYYHRIWEKLLTDSDAVNMLALMARLRWGISLTEFAKILNQTEQAQFVSVKSRIRHLLNNENNTDIYHSSFATFIIEHTQEIDELSYHRIAQFCIDQNTVRFCILNRIFHLLRTGDRRVFAECNQAWVDATVTLGVEPDTLIADIDAVVDFASKEASVDDFFRLMLLSQRISFRYDTLFAQSARLIAEALIALGRPKEALQHVRRFKTLIVGPEEVHQVAFVLHQHGYDIDALDLLDELQQRIVESYNLPCKFLDIIQFCSLHLHTIFLIRLAGGWSGMKQFFSVLRIAQHACDEFSKETGLSLSEVMLDLNAIPLIYFLTFKDEYSDLDSLKAYQQKSGYPDLESLPQHLKFICTVLLGFESSADVYRLSKSRKSLNRIFADFEALIQTSEIDASLAHVVADSLIRFGAPSKVIELLIAKGTAQPFRPLQIRAKNGVDVNHKDLQECLCDWRVAAFLNSNYSGPYSGIITGLGWFESMEHIIGALYCLDGKARRAKADSDELTRRSYFDQLTAQVIDPLQFTLQQRAEWKDSYAIPETALPEVYRQLAELLFECFPEKLPHWLDNLIASTDSQWGMYSEGFRASVYSVMEQLMREKLAEDIAQKLFDLLLALSDHVVRGVENRHELVPEILRMIPFFVKLGAKEEAERLYQQLLSVSMGPTWYKEDQLGIMNEVLGSISVSHEIVQRLPQVAGYLERAAGEMTFQRYVRAEKSSLIGQIARLGKYRAALAYFRRQCCGSLVELWAEAQEGVIDKVGSFKGSRFPGGALDDQDAILALVRNSGTVSWTFRWALLEIFHCGDSRHLSNYAEAFAAIANEIGAVPELIQRAEIVLNAETPSDERNSFAIEFRNTLKTELHTGFAAVLNGLPPIKEPEAARVRSIDETAYDETEGRLFSPGLFGSRAALRDADKMLEEAEKQLKLGNRTAAKAHAIKVLQIAQEGGWNIWGKLSDGARMAEEILLQQETRAVDVIRYYAPLIEAERYQPKWILAEYIIRRVAPLLAEMESQQLLAGAIDHCRLMVGDASREIQSFNFLADYSSEHNSDVEFFQFIVWLCNHPLWLRRDRAAVMLLWVVENVPSIFSEAVELAFSMDEGYGPDVLCGVLDGASFREPVALWDRVADVLDLTKVMKELRHVSRMVVLERLATRADKAGSLSAKSALEFIRASYTGITVKSINLELPVWGARLAAEWHKLKNLVNTESIVAWEKELVRLCSPISISDALKLENAVAISFRVGNKQPFDRWESKLRHALNLALWQHVSRDGAHVVESTLRVYNPSQPERTIIGVSNSFTDQIIAAIESVDYSDVFSSDAMVMLNYHDIAVKPTDDGTSYVEVLCLIQPTSTLRQAFSPRLGNFFRSSELPQSSTVMTPFETCCRLIPEVMFFGSFTPAIPLSFFQNLVGAKADDFVRQNWRYGRRNKFLGFGQPERIGCSLSVPRKALKMPSGFKLVWLVRVNYEIVTIVDEHNNRLI